MSGTPLAYVDPRRQIYVLDGRGRHLPQTWSADRFFGQWTVAAEETSAWSWPTWSPDARRLGCFRIAQDATRTAHVQVLEVGGVTADELVDLGDRLPIYLFWSPSGEHLAVLSQRDDRLMLTVAHPGEVGNETELAEGSPLFFTWAGERVAAYVGNGDDSARMALIDPRDARPTVVLPGMPANFCAPIALPDGVLYVAQREGRTWMVVGRAGSAEVRDVAAVDGLAALVASPDRRTIARALAPGGDGTPYTGLALVDVASGEETPLEQIPECLAFTWSPTGDCLLVARVDTDRNLLTWSRVDRDGRAERLVDTYPTRDLGFYLRFFEQYTQSHPLVDPAGRHLVLAGGLHGHGDPHGRPRLWRVSIDDGSVEELGEGVFAVWAPR